MYLNTTIHAQGIIHIDLGSVHCALCIQSQNKRPLNTLVLGVVAADFYQPVNKLGKISSTATFFSLSLGGLYFVYKFCMQCILFFQAVWSFFHGNIQSFGKPPAAHPCYFPGCAQYLSEAPAPLLLQNDAILKQGNTRLRKEMKTSCRHF